MITVVLCTYNRCQLLVGALESVAAQTLSPATEWEVLVVDNNSNDGTPAVVGDFCSRYPGRFRYIFEHRPGKSNALNTAIGEAKGSILAFLDDDVVAEPNWLLRLTAGLRTGEWAGAGGRILPDQPFSPPRWLPAEDPRMLRVLALFDLGPEPGPLTESPLGTNMAFRKEAFERYGRFRADLGPRPDSEIRGEDTEFGNRILAAGARLRYEPSAVVLHAVAGNRLKKDYFLSWWFDKGRSELREYGFPSEARWFIGPVPVVMFRRLARWTAEWLVTVHPSRRFSRKIEVWKLAGWIWESYRRSHAGGADLSQS